ncbi:hypothetical protein JRO89_XS08G0160900 [Xanthoceras sorbifolium]|uniref:Uncharacterized protein n=1 Tax=Xanthoceras sorbifolium TaxID=99658 RepID=A0ABQ8HQ70_9ROSI|nr:hypothetical protein JRO89_XS08G0160900 [Xanthoceras sorbifolium]
MLRGCDDVLRALGRALRGPSLGGATWRYLCVAAFVAFRQYLKSFEFHTDCDTSDTESSSNENEDLCHWSLSTHPIRVKKHINEIKIKYGPRVAS